MRGKRAKQLRRVAQELEEKVRAIEALSGKEPDHGRVSLYRKLKREYTRVAR